jgi:hypothetical protein
MLLRKVRMFTGFVWLRQSPLAEYFECNHTPVGPIKSEFYWWHQQLLATGFNTPWREYCIKILRRGENGQWLKSLWFSTASKYLVEIFHKHHATAMAWPLLYGSNSKTKNPTTANSVINTPHSHMWHSGFKPWRKKKRSLWLRFLMIFVSPSIKMLCKHCTVCCINWLTHQPNVHHSSH